MTEETKITLYNKLSQVWDTIPLNKYVDRDEYYINDEEIINAIKRKIIEPYESNPVVGDVVSGKSTISERIRPIVSKADEVRREYEQIRFIRRFDPEQEIFGENENLIAKELEDILNIKKTYEKDFIVSERFQEIVDKIYGFNAEKGFKGFRRPVLYNLRNGLPVALAAVYFVGPSLDPGTLVEKYPIIGDIAIGFLGELTGALASFSSSLFFIYGGSDKIEKETDRLKKQAQFLDETITELYK